MNGGIGEVKVKMDQNGEYKQVTIKFGKHHTLNVFEKNFRINFELLSGKHGFKVNGNSFDKDLESISAEIEKNHPDKKIKDITEENKFFFRGDIERDTEYFRTHDFKRFKKIFPEWDKVNKIISTYLVSESTFHVIIFTDDGFQVWWYDMNVNKVYKLGKWDEDPENLHRRLM